MEEMIAKWMRETLTEKSKAQSNQNLYRMSQMETLYKALINMRDKLLKTQG